MFSQDLRRALVVPVMNDVLHDVSVAAGGDRLEEIPGLGGEPAIDAGRGNARHGPLDHVRKVEQDAAHLRIALQHGDQHLAVAARDIDQCLDPREVIGIERGGNDERAEGGHRVVEHL